MQIMKLLLTSVLGLSAASLYATCSSVWVTSNQVEIRHRELDSGSPIVIKPNINDYHIAVRDDAKPMVAPLVQALAQRTGVDAAALSSTLRSDYLDFTYALAGKWGDVFASRAQSGGKVIIDIFSLNQLIEGTYALANGHKILTLDSVFTEADYHLFQSMRWILDGTAYFAEQGKPSGARISRPGRAAFSDQIELLKASGAQSFVVNDDVLFSGDTLLATVDLARDNQLNTTHVIVGISIGNQKTLGPNNIPVKSIVTYEHPQGGDIFERANMYLQADFLPGIGAGLVVQLPSGKFARSPYVAPFSDPSFQANAPGEFGFKFSRAVLQDAAAFYAAVEKSHNIVVLLSDLDIFFVNYCTEIFHIDPQTPIQQVLQQLTEQMPELLARVTKIAQEQRTLLDIAP
jgi:hypothetical protein